MEDRIESISRKVSIHFLKKKEEHLKEELVRYAKENFKQKNQETEVIFILEQAADEIIELGIREYIKSKKP